jgi:phytoene desaturase
MADEVERVCGRRRRRATCATSTSSPALPVRDEGLHRPQHRHPFDLLTPNLARLAAVGGFRRLAPKVEQYLKDPRTQRVLSFQSMYAGLSPYDALAIYAVIAYMDSVAGVYFPKGGMHAVPRALAGAAEKHGVDLRYGTSVSRVLVEHGRAVGVETATASASPPTSSSSTPTCRSPTASCCRRRRRRAA